MPNPVLVREQLRRLLAHPLFTNSKRYPVLLAHTVERALLGNSNGLKERTIGVEAFGREPSYDVGLDPVVRMTAAEVRKRLSQYYYDPGHAGELVIELPLGSYVPCFREPANHQEGSATAAVPTHDVGMSSPGSITPTTPPSDASRARVFLGLRARHWASIAIALMIAAFVGYDVGRVKLSNQPSSIERFWEPFTANSNRVTYCLAEPILSVDHERIAGQGTNLNSGALAVSDVVTLARSIVPLVPRNTAFRVLAASDTGFAQLREGPFVLIGAFDNPWTMRITQDLPIGFEVDDEGRKVVDRKSKKSWRLQWLIPHAKLERDYAVVARIHDKVTGQPVVILGGILGEGTEAASEVVSNPAYLNAMLEKAPRSWNGLNLEAVIETHVIDNQPGPPMMVAIETW
jgi:hypothetical protein